MAARLVKVTIVSWWLDGRRVPPRTPGAAKVKRQSPKWYGEDIPGQPARRRVPLATDKTVAARMLADLVERGERGQAGMADLAQARRPLAEHAAEYRQAQLDDGDTAKHARHTHQMVTAIIAGCKFGVMGDLSASAVAKWIGEQRRRKVKPIGVETANHYLTAIKAFSAWLVADRRTTIDPLKHLSKGNAKADRKRVRRALSLADVNRIIAAARSSTTEFRGLSGPARAALYMTAGMTGFRRAELAALTPGSFALDTSPPTAHLPAAVTKNRTAVTQPIPQALAAEIREYANGTAAGALLWPGTWSERGAEMLRVDLAAAGVPYEVNGEVADLHSLRHTFITWLVEVAGATVKQAQVLSRHSDPSLTIGRYTHAGQAELGGVVGRIADDRLLPGGDDVAALKRLVLALAERVYAQSELLIRRAMRTQTGTQTGRRGEIDASVAAAVRWKGGCRFWVDLEKRPGSRLPRPIRWRVNLRRAGRSRAWRGEVSWRWCETKTGRPPRASPVAQPPTGSVHQVAVAQASAIAGTGAGGVGTGGAGIGGSGGRCQPNIAATAWAML